MKLLKSLGTVGKAAKKCAPTLLSIAGAGGVVLTGIEAARAGYADAQLDQIASVHGNEDKPSRARRKIKTYAKPVIFGAVSVGCILTGDRLHARRYAALGAAASVIQGRYDNLRESMRLVNGYTEYPDGSRKDITEPGAMEQLQRQRADSVTAVGMLNYCRAHGIEPEDTHTGNKLWYEPISRTYFLASEDHVTNAEYHANRNFKLRGEEPFSEFLRFLELKAGDQPGYDMLHWDDYEGETYYGYQWIDFVHLIKQLQDGPDYTQIFYPFEPHLSEK